MAKAQSTPCSLCRYWQLYPTWKGMGVCDNPVSRDYTRGVLARAQACEYFEVAEAEARARSV